MKVGLFALVFALVAASWAAELAGLWSFEARTDDGLLRGELSLTRDNTKIQGRMVVDGHVLEGEGETDGSEFSLRLTHGDGTGSGHESLLYLTGRFSGAEIAGTWDDGTRKGRWSGVRKQRAENSEDR